MKVEVQLQGLEGVLDTLKRLPPEVVSNRGGPVRRALAKGARLLRDEAKQNLRASIAIRGENSTGETERAVTTGLGRMPAGQKGELYQVRVRKKTFTNALGRRTSTIMTARFLEYGTAHQPATPWLRPAVLAKGEQVISVVTADLRRRIELAAQNRGR